MSRDSRELWAQKLPDFERDAGRGIRIVEGSAAAGIRQRDECPVDARARAHFNDSGEHDA